jgi:hypothetical protein
VSYRVRRIAELLERFPISFVMPLSIGAAVHSEITNEEGRIVRILKIDGRIGYVVAIVNKVSGKELEAFWRPQELKEVKDAAPKYPAARRRSG